MKTSRLQMSWKTCGAKLILIMLMVILFAVPSSALAATGDVASIGSTTYATLQEAIDAAGEGDTVTLLKDTAENIAVSGKKLTFDLGGYTLTSMGAADSTFFSVTDGADVTVKNGTLAGEVDTEGNPVQVAYAVYVSGSTFTLDKATISGHSVAVSGGGIYADAATINVLNGSVITGNKANGETRTTLSKVGDGGGAIYACNKSNVIVNASTISDNTGFFGGGIYLVESTLQVKNGSVLTQNIAYSTYNGNYTGGGAIYSVKKSTVTISDSELTKNEGRLGGAIYIHNNYNLGNSAMPLTITNSKLNNNYAVRWGGAIAWQSYVKYTPATVSITGGEICGNAAGVGGSAVYQFGVTVAAYSKNYLSLSLDSVEISDNVNNGTTTGTIYSQRCGNVSIVKCTISQNTGGAAGALYLDNSSAKITGGSITNNSVTSNNLASAGAISLSSTDNVSCKISGCRISGNSAQNGAGAINLYITGLLYSGNITVTDTVITGNTGEVTGGINFSGSYPLRSPSNLTFNGNGAIYGNTASVDADGDINIYSNGAGISIMQPSTMYDPLEDIKLTDYAFINGEMAYDAALTTVLHSSVSANGLASYRIDKPELKFIAENITEGSVHEGFSYTSIAAALTDAATDATTTDTIKLIGEAAEVYENNTVSKNLELQLNGHTLTSVSGTTLTVNAGMSLTLAGPGKLTASQGTGLVVSGNAAITGAVEISAMQVSAATSEVTLSDKASVTNLSLAKGAVVKADTGSKIGTVKLAADEIKKLNLSSDDYSVIIAKPVDGADLSSLANTLQLEGANVLVSIGLDDDGNVVASCKKLEGVFIDGVNGSDDNSGLSADAPVKTFEKAKEVLNNSKFSTIYVLNTVTVSDTQEWSLAEGQSMLRHPACVNDLICVTGTLTLENIAIDGNREQVVTASSIVDVSGGKLVLNDGAVLRNNENRNSAATTCGGAVYASQGTVEVNGGEIVNNYAMRGGGIYAQTKSTVKLSGGKISNNEAGIPTTNTDGYGGGIAVNYSSSVEITGGEISSNKSNNWAGGIAVGQSALIGEPCTLEMTGGTIQNNAASSGGGIYIQSLSTGYISGGVITGNKVTYGNYAGGGIYVNGGYAGYDDGILVLTNAIVKENSARNGGGVAGCETSTVTMHNGASVAVYNNTASEADNKASDVLLYWGFTNAGSSRPEYYLSEYMLGGGAYNWKNSDGTPVSNSEIVSGSAYRFLTSNPSDASIQAAENARTANNGALITGNSAKNGYGGGIGSNGIVILGEKADTITIDVTKQWDDTNTAEKLTEDAANNRYLLPVTSSETVHPASFKVWLLRNDEKVSFVEFKREIVTIDETEYYSWPISLQFEKQLKTDAAGNLYVYTIVEELPDGSKYLPAISGSPVDGFTLKNVYEPKAYVSFPVEKVLEVPTGLTAGDITGKFTFTLTAEDGVPMPPVVEYTNPDAAGGMVTFGEIEYTAPGEYKYTVTETGTAAGVTNDTEAAKIVTVKVKDNGDGTLTATADSTTDAPLTFTNTYSVQPTTVSFPVEKVLEVPTGLTTGDITGKFTFTLTAEDGVPMPTVVEYTNPDKDGGMVTFGEIEYTKPGTYKYTVTESGSAAGVTNDTEAAKTVTVTVVDNGNGTLTATADSTDTAPLTFTNRYGVEPTKASFPVEKVLTVPTGLTAGDITGKFTFTLTAEDGVPMPTVVEYTNPDAAGGVVTFGEIEYTKPGTYKYTVTETGEVKGVTNDTEAAKTVIVTVVDNGDGTLTATADSTDADPLTFTNTYSVEPTKATFQISKTLVGRAMKEGEFSFELKDATGKVLQTKTNAADGSVSFDEITCTAPGTFAYTISEVSGTLNGVTYDDGTINVTVEVVDNGDGTLTATASCGEKKGFENRYYSSNQLVLTGTKKITGRAFKADDVFTMELLDGETVIQRCVVKPAGGGEKAFSFAPITYTNDEAGTYRYTVREATGNIKGMTYDVTQYTVDVTVVDDGKGGLQVDAVYSVNGKETDSIVFTNTYEATGELVLTAEKTVNGVTPTADQVFSFTLSDEEGEIETVQNKLGEIAFTKLTYTLDDLGEHIYTIHETTAGEGNLTTDDTVYTVNVTVADNGDGTLNVAKEITADGRPADEINFNNIIEAPLTISKTVMGCETAKTFGMTVTLYNADGTEANGTFTYTGDVEGELSSGDVIQLGHNQQITIKGLIPGMKYQVQEEKTPAFSAMVNNTFSSEAVGTLTAEGAKVSFVNTLVTTDFSVTKEWRGGDEGAILLTLYANGEKIEPQPECIRSGNHYKYQRLPQFDEDGDLIVYTAKEKYVDGYMTMYVNVEPNKDVTNVLHNGGTVINKKIVEASFTVQKVWSGLAEDEEAPEITLILYCNGEATDYPTPKPDKNGWYKYYDLPEYVGDEPAVYTVKEEASTGFSTTYTLANGEAAEYADNGGTITNTLIPKTGDDAPVTLWLTAMLASAAALLLMTARRKKA